MAFLSRKWVNTAFLLCKFVNTTFFVAKFCKYALIDSFQGYPAVVDSSASCAALVWVHLPLGQECRVWFGESLLNWENLLSAGENPSSICFCYMNWRICDQSGICDQFLHCYQYWRILFFSNLRAQFSPPRGQGNPSQFYPRGDPSSQF